MNLTPTSGSQATASGVGASWNPAGIAALPFLLPFAVYVLHTLDELPGFAAWATRHFGSETTSTFAAYHVPLILLVLLCSWRALVAGRNGGWVVMATAFQWQFACNAVFHLVTWIAFGEYSPGAVTAAAVSLPATVYYLDLDPPPGPRHHPRDRHRGGNRHPHRSRRHRLPVPMTPSLPPDGQVRGLR